MPRVDYGSAWNSKDLNNIENLLLCAKAQIDGTLDNLAESYTGDELLAGDQLSLGLL